MCASRNPSLQELSLLLLLALSVISAMVFLIAKFHILRSKLQLTHKAMTVFCLTASAWPALIFLELYFEYNISIIRAIPSCPSYLADYAFLILPLVAALLFLIVFSIQYVLHMMVRYIFNCNFYPLLQIIQLPIILALLSLFVLTYSHDKEEALNINQHPESGFSRIAI